MHECCKPTTKRPSAIRSQHYYCTCTRVEGGQTIERHCTRKTGNHTQANKQPNNHKKHTPPASQHRKNSAFSISVASLILLLISRRVCCFKNNSILKWFASSLTSPRHLQVRYYKKMLCLRWKDRLTKLVMHRRCHR